MVARRESSGRGDNKKNVTSPPWIPRPTTILLYLYWKADENFMLKDQKQS